jgi:hypothetical protein
MLRNAEKIFVIFRRLPELAGKLPIPPHAQFFGFDLQHFEAVPETVRGRLPALEDRRALRFKLADLLLFRAMLAFHFLRGHTVHSFPLLLSRGPRGIPSVPGILEAR